MDINYDEIVAELKKLQQEYEEALDEGNEAKARLIQRRIDAIERHL